MTASRNISQPVDISIVIPIYNVELFLEKCLASVKDQIFTSFEVLLIIDGSTDSSIEIANSYAKKDPRFNVIEQENKGLGGARNTGIKAAKGDYLFLLDSDDFIDVHALEYLFAFAKKNELDIVVFDYLKVTETGKVLAAPKFGNGVVSKEKALENILSLSTSPQAWNKLYRRSLFIDNNILYPEKFLHEDLPVTYRVFYSANNIGYLNKPLYYWLYREGSITASLTFKHVEDIVTSFIEIHKFLSEHQVIEKYDGFYQLGAAKMLNVLINRAIDFSGISTAFSVYVQYVYQSSKTFDREKLYMINELDRPFTEKFSRNIKRLDAFVVQIKSTEVSPEASQFKEDPGLKSSLMPLINFLMPLTSKRRKILSKSLSKFR
jgi:glycosyltransferase involved in cell wall biosynthesis